MDQDRLRLLRMAKGLADRAWSARLTGTGLFQSARSNLPKCAPSPSTWCGNALPQRRRRARRCGVGSKPPPRGPRSEPNGYGDWVMSERELKGAWRW